jgi:UPF0042 nucleotide-binding protein
MSQAPLENPDIEAQRIVFVTGPSGAGRTTAIRVFEDLGFEAIDNLSLLPRLISGPIPDRPLVLGLDVRNRDFSVDGVLDALAQLEKTHGFKPELIYLDCRHDVLLRRFSETRRRHPLAPDESPGVGIEREARLLGPIRSRADVLIDTSDMTPHDLREEIDHHFMPDGAGRLAITVASFSYKRGLPQGLDMAFDCRFLNNPHWEPELRAHTGLDAKVAGFVAADPRHDAFLGHLLGLVRFVLPEASAEGKAHLTLGLGCTGGRHRSVAIAESVGRSLAADGWRVSTRHRELERNGLAGARARMPETREKAVR